jgi:hypothetical protein
MSKIITGRILNGVRTPMLALSNDQIGRTFQIGSGWSRLAIGIRFGLDAAGTLLNCGFALGVCNGTTKMYKSATTNNFFGLTGSGTATFGSNTFSLPFFAARKVGVTETNTSVASMLIGNLDLAGGADGRLHTLIVQLTKNGSTIDFTSIYASNTVSGVVLQSRSDWINSMESEPLVIPNSGYVLTSTAGFTFDEATNGVLDTVNVSWGQAASLCIADIGIAPKRL